MKLLAFLFCFTLTGLTLQAQEDDDRKLSSRLTNYLTLYKELKFDEMLEYMHPDLYKIVQKGELAAALKHLYQNEELPVSIDSIGLVRIGAEFIAGDRKYRDVTYASVMTLKFKDSGITESEETIALSMELLKLGYDDKQVTYDRSSDKFYLRGESFLIAIQDKTNPWQFILYEKNNGDVLEKIFPKKVLAHYKSKIDNQK